MSVFQRISQYDFLISLFSCIVTILALVFTLYLWLLDQMSDEEAKFLEGKKEFLTILYNSLNIAQNSKEPMTMLKLLQDVNDQLEIVMNYRFWARTKRKEEYNKINEFYQDSKYMISTIRRFLEAERAKDLGRSLIAIPDLDESELDDIQSDYRNGLSFIIEFMENWD